jgi:hypothetical protein
VKELQKGMVGGRVSPPEGVIFTLNSIGYVVGLMTYVRK